MAHVSTKELPKFKRLCLALGVSGPATLGHLEYLWQFTHSTVSPARCQHPQFPSDDIEMICEWTGESGVLLDALLKYGWLDDDGEGLVSIHDYWDHCPVFVKDRFRKYDERNNKDNPGQSRNVPDSPPKGKGKGKGKGKVVNVKAENEIENAREARPDPESADSCESFSGEGSGEDGGEAPPVSDYHALIPERLGGGTRSLAERALAVSNPSEKRGPGWLEWWRKTETLMLSDRVGGYGDFLEFIKHEEDSSDPIQRQMKELGVNPAPGKTIAKKGSSRESVGKTGLESGHPGSLLGFKAYEESNPGDHPNACRYLTQPA